MILNGFDKNTADIQLMTFDELQDDDNLKLQYLSWLNDREVTKYFFREDFFDTNKKLDYIEQSFIRFTKEDNKGFFINYLPQNMFVGTITLKNPDRVNRNTNIGIMIGERDLWGKGIGFKSFAILMRYIFKELQFHCIHSSTDRENIAMQKLFKKLNFKETGYLRHIIYYDNKYRDLIIYSILEDECLLF